MLAPFGVWIVPQGFTRADKLQLLRVRIVLRCALLGAYSPVVRVYYARQFAQAIRHRRPPAFRGPGRRLLLREFASEGRAIDSLDLAGRGCGERRTATGRHLSR